MGLIEQEIKELRQMNAMRLSGVINRDEIFSGLAIYSQIEKRIKLMLQIKALDIKLKGKASSDFVKQNIIGDGEAIDISSDYTKEKVACPSQEKDITRIECRRFSETTGNLLSCYSCRNFKTTRRLLNDAI